MKKPRKQVKVHIPTIFTPSLSFVFPTPLESPLRKKKRLGNAGEESYFNASEWFEVYYLLLIDDNPN